jgi:tyrosyl-tRNA synthetase
LQLAGAPTVVAGGLARPEMGLAAPMALGEVPAEAKPMSAEEAKKKLEIALSKQVEIAAKIGLASVALGEMYRQMDRIVKARAKDLADLEKMSAESKKKKKEIFLQVGEAANDNASSMTNQDARVEEKEYKIAYVLKFFNLVNSTSDAIRLLDQGGVKINGNAVTTNFTFELGKLYQLQIGKRKFARIQVS